MIIHPSICKKENMKQIYLTALLVSSMSLPICAQNTPVLNWAQSMGSASNEGVNAIATDSNGDIVVIGTYDGTTDFDPGPGTETLVSFTVTAYVAKYAQNGDLIWVYDFPSSNWSELKYLYIGADNSIYASGSYYGSVDLAPGTTTNVITTSSVAAFMIKMDPSGNIEYTYDLETTLGSSSFYNMTVNTAKEVYFVTYQSGIVDYDNGIGSAIVDNSATWGGYYLNKLNSDGTYSWVKESEFAIADMVTDNNDHVFLCGALYGTAPLDIEPGPAVTNATCSPSMDAAFVVKLDADGSYLDHFIMETNAQVEIQHLTIDSQNQDILVSGLFDGQTNFEPASTSYVVDAIYSDEVYVARYSNAGDIKWVFRTEGSSTSSCGDIKSVSSDMYGNVYLAGELYNGPLDMDPGAGVENLGGSSFVHYLLKWDSLGNFNWAYTMLPDAELNTIALSADGNHIYFGGDLSASADVDPEGTAEVPCSGCTGDNDIFLVKWNNCDLDVTIFNNGSALEAVETSAGTTYQWYDLNGDPIPGATNSTYTPTVNGGYQVLITKGDCSYFSSMYSVTNVGLESTNPEVNLIIYPNPAENYLMISGITETGLVEIIDLLGDIVYQSQVTSDVSQINIGQLASGSYLLRVTQHGSISNIHFVKN